MNGVPSERFNIHRGRELTCNVLPLLHEIRHALATLLDSGQASVIDLRSIPLAPGEEDAILEALGQGEVRAGLSALGPSEIYETRYAGVWLVTHYNEGEEMVGRFIEVTDMPEVLKSQRDDIARSAQDLADRLATEE